MGKNYEYYIADVFTNQPFNGAQIAVFPDAAGLNTRLMGLVARELNLSETVFVTESPSSQNQWRVRTFSPQGEVNFAGHPIIATAYTLASCGKITLGQPYTSVLLEQNIGVIEVNISGKDKQPSFVQFSRRFSSTVDLFAPTDYELARLLSLEPKDIANKSYSARLVSSGAHPYLIVPVKSYEAVRSAVFDASAWSQTSAPQTAAQEILLFADRNPFQDADFNARLVGPRIGVTEDPPVGSAMPAFAAYLCSFDHVQPGTHSYRVDRGDSKCRRSVLNIEMDNEKSDELTLRVGGEAVMIAEGTLDIPEEMLA